jgi:hypothetical protein
MLRGVDRSLLATAHWLFVEQSAWITSGVSAVVVWQMGNRRWWAPWLGVAGQVFWVVLALQADQPGLLPGVGLYTIIHLRNAIKWRAD